MRIKYLPQDNEARINNGIVLYDGKPYICGLVSTDEISLSPIYRKANAEAIKVRTNDEKLDISSPPLGYVNRDSQALYVVRKPERKYKQSLRPDACYGYYPYIGAANGDDVHYAIYSQQGEKMFTGDYPTIDVAISYLKYGKKVSVAVSRDVCIALSPKQKYEVLIMNDPVGELIDNTVKTYEPKFKWVVERKLARFEQWKIE